MTLSASERECFDLKATLEHTEKDREFYRAQFQDRYREVLELRDQVARLQSKYEQAVVDRGQAKSDLALARTQFQDQCREVLNLRNQVTELQKELESKDRTIATLVEQRSRIWSSGDSTVPRCEIERARHAGLEMKGNASLSEKLIIDAVLAPFKKLLERT